jgi:hypothetical protein
MEHLHILHYDMAGSHPYLGDTSGRATEHGRAERSRAAAVTILGASGGAILTDAHISVAEILQTGHKSTCGDRAVVQADQDDGGIEEIG